MRAAAKPDQERLDELDADLRQVIELALKVIPSGDAALESLFSFAKLNHDEARLHAMETLIREQALACGLAQGRRLNSAEFENQGKALAEYREAQADVITRYPKLAKDVDDIVAFEEQRGIRMRLDADKIAITISIALRRFMPDAKTLYAALDKKSSFELGLIKEASESRSQNHLKFA